MRSTGLRTLCRILLSALLVALASMAAGAQERRKIEVVPATAHNDGVTSLAFSPNGRFLLSGGGDSTPRLWDVATGRLLRIFRGHSGHINAVAFSPDGRFAVSGSLDATLKLWDIETGQAVHTFSGHSEYVTSVAFSRDGRSILSGARSDPTLEEEEKSDPIRLWDVARGRLIRTFKGQTWEVHSVALSPDRRLALSGDKDGKIKLWDTSKGRSIRTFTGNLPEIIAVAFAADARSALSASRDSALKVWTSRQVAKSGPLPSHQSQSVRSRSQLTVVVPQSAWTGS